MSRSERERKERLRILKSWGVSAMADLSCLPRLRSWSFAPGATFEPYVLNGLARWPDLQHLSFQNSDLSRDDLLSLALRDSLKHLDLKECRFDLADFRLLCDEWARGACPHLAALWLEATAIGDEELRAMGQIERLQTLVLSHTQISDVGLAHLRGLKKLETLWLRNSNVSDDGVLRLAVLPRLTYVVLGSVHRSEQLNNRLFRAQVALQKSEAPLDAAQLQAADARLRAFLRDMEKWERDTWSRHGELRSRFSPLRDFSHEVEKLRIESIAPRAAIITRYCSRKLQTRSLAHFVQYNPLPQFQTPTDWIDAETPTKKNTLFYGEGRVPKVDKRRYTLVLEDGEWKLDAVHRWNATWRREYL